MKAILIFSASLFSLAFQTEAQASWSLQNNSPSTNILSCVFFPDVNNGWVAGSFPSASGPSGVHYIWNSADNGRTWVAKSATHVHAIVFSIYFVNIDTGWAVAWDEVTAASGIEHLIFKTVNGGASWSQINIGSDMASIYFPDPNTGYTVGGVGKIYVTKNSGSSWTEQDYGTTHSLHSVNFASADVGWIAGDSGTVIKTINGATTWAIQPSGTTRNLAAIRFANTNVGWAVGDSGTIIKTANGGTTWTTQISGTTQNLKSVFFTDVNNGWAVGGLGTILKTTNGGTQWMVQPAGTTKNLNSVYFVDFNNGWAVGDSGAIVKYSIPTPILFQMPSLENHFGKFSYQLTSPSHISAIIYDLHGKMIAKLFDGNQPAGNHELEVPRQMPSLESYILDFQTNGNHKAVRLQGR